MTCYDSWSSDPDAAEASCVLLRDALLERGDLLLGGGDDVDDRVHVRGLCLAADEVDVDVLGEVNVAFRNRLQGRRLQTGGGRVRTERIMYARRNYAPCRSRSRRGDHNVVRS